MSSRSPRSLPALRPKGLQSSPASTMVLELPVIAIGTQAYTCTVSCGSACCRYFALPLDTPRTDREHDDIRWFLMHGDTHVYKQEGDWYLLVMRECRYLLASGLCGNYERRPAICSEYDAQSCEFTDVPEYELYFRDDVEFDAYLAKRRADRSERAQRAARTRRRRTPARA